MECLLSYIEFTQYQQYILKEHYDKTFTDLNLPGINDQISIIEFPSNIPQSAIVSAPMQIRIRFSAENDNFDDMYDLKKKAHRLYQRYIVNDAEFQINISGTQRNLFANMMHDFDAFSTVNMEYKELLLLFNGVKEEMRLLLEYSFGRFKSSPQWSQIDLDTLSNIENGQSVTM